MIRLKGCSTKQNQIDCLQNALTCVRSLGSLNYALACGRDQISRKISHEENGVKASFLLLSHASNCMTKLRSLANGILIKVICEVATISTLDDRIECVD